MSVPSEFSQRVRECIDRLSAEGVSALGLLYELTARRLVRFAVAISHRQPDAEDAMQAVLTRLAVDPRRLADAECPWAYLLRMVRNELLANLRRQKRYAATGDLSDMVTYCPVDEAEREESQRAVWAALRQLPVEQAEVVVLKIWEELTFAEIAAVLELSPNTVASRYQYGIAKLSSRLAKPNQAEVRHE